MKSMLIILVGLALTSIAPTAQAQLQDERGWIGGAFGLSVPSEDSLGSRPIYGITAGAKVGTEFGVGIYYLTSSQKDRALNGLDLGFAYDLYGVEFAYHFEGEAKGVYLGGRLGLSKVTAESPLGGNISSSPMHWGPVAGYNHMLGSNFSLGGDVSYVSISDDNGADGFGTLNFLGTVKLWF